MKLRRKVAAIMLFAAMLVGTETGIASAQDTTPDLRMLMNLDLFEPRANGANGAPAPAAAGAPADDSMLNQIRTLDAMGYLGNHAETAGAAAGGNDAPAPRAPVGDEPGAAYNTPAEAPESVPSSRPSYDVEGPQP